MNTENLTKLRVISAEFDASHNELKKLLESKTTALPSDCTSEAMSKLTEAIDLIDREIQSVKQVLQGGQSISQLKLRISKLIERTTAYNGNADISEQEQSSQPSQLSQSSQLSPGCSTPQSKTVVVQQDHEDFPSTPTLEQLGLSGPALSIVGGRRLGFDSSVSNSDTEFDNSFYQKSPVTGIDNSFSSDVSVPNFRILNSSPSTSLENRSSKRLATGNKTNLKQVTTAKSVLIDFDSSLLLSDDSSPKPASKRVHVQFDIKDNSENKLTNNK